MNITKIVKNNKAIFDFYRNDYLYYNIINKEGIKLYSFHIDISDKKDIAGATFNNEYNAITLMRYIRKCIESNEFVIY